MADVEVRVSKRPQASKRPKGVTVKILQTPSGESARVLTVDANSASFASDFLYVFKQNVRKARQENKERLGSARGVKKRA
jgi:hypothetical protein